ncbi:MAG: FAD-dependent thymidylate synthase [Syntrophomonadaceae bacterium]|jgi:thymidylate synthase (FAD)|nr:FAD-dependent thymidylate synthase [Syntrophomonadaceae bacterium]
MKVKLVAYTPEPEKTVALAGRMCYSNRGVDNLADTLTPAEVERMVKMLTEVGHLSPIEHVSFTFAVEGISRACSHQLVRHRIASYSQKSQRYVDETSFDYIVPPSIANNPEARELYTRVINTIRESYTQLAEMVPREDARYILPNATETKLVLSFNARSLYNFFSQRLCLRAQWEIREMAQLMLVEVMKVAPLLFSKAGPSCEVEGICWEGKKSCGRCEDVRER